MMQPWQLMAGMFAGYDRATRLRMASGSVHDIVQAVCVVTPDIRAADLSILLLWPIAEMCSREQPPEDQEEAAKEKAGIIAAFRESLDAIENGDWLKPKPKEKQEA